MNKYIKYTPIFFLGIILLASVVYAEDSQPQTTSEKPTETAKQLIDNTRKEFKNNIDQTKNNLKDELTTKKEELKSSIDAQRAEFKKTFDLKKEEMKKGIEASREKLKTDILKIKDAKKQVTVQNIITKIADLNTRAVTNLDNLITNIEDNISKIEIKANEEEAKGTDVTNTRALIVKARASVSDAKTAILSQSTKIYTANITTENALQGTMRKVKESLNTDITTLREKVRTAHRLTKDAVMSLPQNIIDDQTKMDNGSNTKVEEGNTPVNNTTN